MKSHLRDFYIVFYQGFFVPEILENNNVLAEPYRTFVEAFKEFVNKNGKNLIRVIDESDMPFWNKDIYIPKIGKITYCHKKNIVSRLMMGRRREDFRKDEKEAMESDGDYEYKELMAEIRQSEKSHFSKYSYLSSNEHKKILHLPLLISYKKKVSIYPSFNYYVNRFRKQQNKNEEKTFRKLEGSNSQIRCYIHFYTYGLFYIHLAISLTSLTDILPEEIISWLHDLKASSTRFENRQILQTGREFKGTIEELFDYLFQQIINSLLKTENFTILRTPIYDSIRVKPISRITKEDISIVNKTLIKKNDRKNEVYSSLFNHGENFFYRWYRFQRAVNRVKKNGKITLDTLYEELLNAKRNNCDHQKTPILSNLEEFSWSFLKREYTLNSFVKNLSDFILFFINRELTWGLDENVINGFLAKSVRWDRDFIARNLNTSAYGYSSELIIVTTQSMLIAPRSWPVWARRKQLQLLFQWKLIAINEIAFAQKMIITYYTQKMNEYLLSYGSIGTGSGLEPINDSIRFFLNGLFNLSDHLAPHHRKWYYRVADAISLGRRQEEFQSMFERYNQSTNPSLKVLQELIESKQLGSVIDLREAVIRHIQIGNDNAMIFRESDEDEE